MRRPVDLSADRRKVLLLALTANAGLMAGELGAGIAFGSLALIADAVHLLTDVSGLALAILAIGLVERPATRKLSFGLQRAEALAAQANAVVLLAAAAWVVYEAVRRLLHPVHVSGSALAAVGAVGLAVNLGSALLLRPSKGRSLNMRAAFLHLAADAVGSLGAVAAGLAILAWGALRADPAVSLLISLLVVLAAWRLLRDATHVLLEGTPKGLDPEEVERAIRDQAGVDGVHHLHLWSLASDVPALSAHVVLARRETSIHDAQVQGDRLKAMLADRFGVHHVTLEVECHGHPEDDPAQRW